MNWATYFIILCNCSKWTFQEHPTSKDDSYESQLLDSNDLDQDDAVDLATPMIVIPNDEDEIYADEEPEPLTMEKRLYISRQGFRPAKRSMAIGRAGMRPGKRAFAAGWNRGKRSMPFAESYYPLYRNDFSE